MHTAGTCIAMERQAVSCGSDMWEEIVAMAQQETAHEAYCVKCKIKREIKNAHEEKMDNGRRALKGECPVCGTKLTRFLPSEK
jgi:hypothetical protein